MIDRRHFVQSLLVLGAATGLRPSTVLFGFPPSGELRDLADAVKGKLSSGILLLGARDGDRCHLVAGVTSDLTGRFSASDIVRRAAALVGGGGGGRKDMAQAGGSRVGNLPEALASISTWE